MSEIKSDMTGVIDNVLVEVGTAITEGQEVVVIESMKSLITINATAGGTVKEVKVAPGDFVDAGEVLLVLE